MATTKFNDPGLISRQYIYEQLGRNAQTQKVERVFRKVCGDDPLYTQVPDFLLSYNAIFTSYHTAGTDAYDQNFVFFFTPTRYTELAMLGDKLRQLLEDYRPLAGYAKEFQRLEQDLDQIISNRDDLLMDLREDPDRIILEPSLVFVFEQIYAGDPLKNPESYKFIGVYYGLFRDLCYQKR